MMPPSEHSPRDPRRAREESPRSARSGGRGTLVARPRAALSSGDGPLVQGEWLVPPMLLLGLAAGLRLALGGPDSSFAICFALLLGVGVIWIAARLFCASPQAPACPHCKRSTLVRLASDQSTGARCLHCGWRDESADARRLHSPIAPRLQVRGATLALRMVPRARSFGPVRHTPPSRLGEGRFGDRPPQGPPRRRWR